MCTLPPKVVKTIFTAFLIEAFFHLPLGCEYLHKFLKKYETALMGFSGAWGKLIHEKNQKSKISWYSPSKRFPIIRKSKENRGCSFKAQILLT